MELLLTSAGITTPAIADKLTELVANGNKKVGFIATAANVEAGNKDWYIAQITNLQKYGFNWIDFIDPSAANVDWQSRLREVGVLFVSGGNTFHLLDQSRRTGFGSWLREHIEDIVYVGASAGSIIMTPTIEVALVDNGDENLPGITDLTGFSFVDFEIAPHALGMPSVAAHREYAASISRSLYAINDKSALCVVDGELEIVHDGEYWKFN